METYFDFIKNITIEQRNRIHEDEQIEEALFGSSEESQEEEINK
jgi:hypothetical protein